MSLPAISLYELNNLVRKVLDSSLPETFWVRAETSDVRVNQNGHCYLEFIEKDGSGKSLTAKVRGMIWANTFHMLKAYFENSTGQPFTSGIKVLVQVSVEFHELYGLSLTVHDIDPSYTLGDQALNRAAILRQLEEEGVLSLNKELELPVPLNRIAVISSPTAAGYEDFLNQLHNNSFGFIFYTKLFPAIMQGNRSEDSIIHALERIYDNVVHFDTVVIIRGGGATSDLSCFDSYLLAASCAQFPLPVITGIGHERDETVVDIVAHTRAKTPTAVAEFLINNMLAASEELDEVTDSIVSLVQQSLQKESRMLDLFETKNTFVLRSWRKEQELLLDSSKIALLRGLQRIIRNNETDLAEIAGFLKKKTEQNKKQILSGLVLLSSELKKKVRQRMRDEFSRIGTLEKHISFSSPESVLRKGYSLTLKEGKVVKSAHALKHGDEITTIFHDGEKRSVIEDQNHEQND